MKQTRFVTNTPNDISPQPKKSYKNVWVIVGITIGVLLIGAIICLVTGSLGVGNVNAEKASVESVLDSYMKSMVSKEIESAYALFSPRSQRQIPISEIQELVDGNYYILFDGYQNLSVQNINLTVSANTNPDLPQGSVATVNGIINFEGGFQGTFRATLEKVDGKWLLAGINITVPPDKFQLSPGLTQSPYDLLNP